MAAYTILNANSQAGRAEINGGARPLVNGKGQFILNNGFPQVVTPRGLHVNSLLRKDEWEELDAAVVQAAQQRLVGVQDLIEAGLVKQLGGIGTLASQWNEASAMTAADINLTGSGGSGDRVDFNLSGVPVPVIFKDYSIDTRSLAASRRLGDGLDVSNAFAASRVVAEGLENMLFNGASGVKLNGDTVYGYTTHPNRNTDTAANYGGGDWGTITNIMPTILGMISAANADGYYGPFGVYAYLTQYNQALATYTDGSGQTAVDRMLRLPQINFVKPSDWLDAGEVVLVQMTPDVVDVAIAQEITNLEWMSGDGLLGHFKVMSVAVPRIKADYSGNSGIVHATSA